jgi:hypothetical protein
MIRATQNLAESAGAKEGQNLNVIREVAANNFFSEVVVLVHKFLREGFH